MILCSSTGRPWPSETLWVWLCCVASPEQHHQRCRQMSTRGPLKQVGYGGIGLDPHYGPRHEDGGATSCRNNGMAANISKQSQRSKSVTKHQNGRNGDTVSSPVHESEVHVFWQIRSIRLSRISRNIMVRLSVIVHSGAVAHIPSQHFIHDSVHTNRANYTSSSTRCLHSARKIEHFNRWILQQLKWGGRDNFFYFYFLPRILK